MRTKRRLTSRPTTDPNTIDELAPFLKSLQRQHQITLRRVENIQRQLDALPEEDIEPPKVGIVAWFLKLVRYRHG